MNLKKQKLLLSFIGTNDAGKLLNKPDGTIITALKNEKFDEVILLWNEALIEGIHYSEIMLYLKREIKKRKLAIKVTDYEFNLKDVTDHNEIYKQLKDFTDSLEKSKQKEYTAAISSGTPAMQVCWILLAESRGFSKKHTLELIQISPPKLGKSRNLKVKLNTALPKIVSLENELTELRKDLIPTLTVDKKRGRILIGEKTIPMSPIEFCYYRYFAERLIKGEGLERFGKYNVSIKFLKAIHDFHMESFPDLDSHRMEMEKKLRKKFDLPIKTFLGNISKLNSKIKEELTNNTLYQFFQIKAEGNKGARYYGLNAFKDKIRII